MEKYSRIIDSINQGIIEFNRLLNSNNHVPVIDLERIEDKNSSWHLKEEAWFDRPFPNGDSKGIYFVFGYENDYQNDSAVYVGKASHLNSNIGSRLNSHLNNPSDRDKMIYKMRHKNGLDFQLEFVTTIPLDTMPFISSSIEEFLIYFLREKNINLLNHIGNK